MTVPVDGQAAKGPSAKTAVIVLLVSFGVLAIAMTGVALTVWDRIFVTTYAVPGTVRVHLAEGTWNLWQLDDAVGIDTSAVTVTGPDGPVRVTRPGWDRSSIDRDTGTYVSAVEFDAPTDGDYVITVDAPARTRVMLAPSFGALLRAMLPWLVVTGVAGVVQLAGWVMLIIGVTRRQRDRKQAWLAGQPVFAGQSAVPAAPALPPPGWHPDPYGTYRYRWWDGRNWTDQVSQ